MDPYYTHCREIRSRSVPRSSGQKPKSTRRKDYLQTIRVIMGSYNITSMKDASLGPAIWDIISANSLDHGAYRDVLHDVAMNMHNKKGFQRRKLRRAANSQTKSGGELTVGDIMGGGVRRTRNDIVNDNSNLRLEAMNDSIPIEAPVNPNDAVIEGRRLEENKADNEQENATNEENNGANGKGNGVKESKKEDLESERWTLHPIDVRSLHPGHVAAIDKPLDDDVIDSPKDDDVVDSPGDMFMMDTLAEAIVIDTEDEEEEYDEYDEGEGEYEANKSEISLDVSGASTAEDGLEKLTKLNNSLCVNFRSCLRYFRPSEWSKTMTNEDISSMDAHKLTEFPLDSFFEQCEKERRESIRRYQKVAEEKEKEAKAAQDKLNGVRKMLARLLSTLHDTKDSEAGKVSVSSHQSVLTHGKLTEEWKNDKEDEEANTEEDKSGTLAKETEKNDPHVTIIKTECDETEYVAMETTEEDETKGNKTAEDVAGPSVAKEKMQRLTMLNESLCGSFRNCLIEFLPTEWSKTMTDGDISSMDAHKLTKFPLDSFFEQCQKERRESVRKYQLIAEKKEREAQAAQDKLEDLRKMVAQLLSSSLDSQDDLTMENMKGDEVDNLLAFCLKDQE